MTFISGMLLIDASASALNNSGEKLPDTNAKNTTSVKYIPISSGYGYPYASAQSVRYWLRDSLENAIDVEWHTARIHREENIAYTDGNPIKYWDDDLFGYMRASNNKDAEAKAIENGLTPREKTPKKKNSKSNDYDLVTLTRISPLRLGTFVALSPTRFVRDWGVMARQEGDPVTYEHNFYRAVLQGLFSLDLGMAGKFYRSKRTGFQNLDSVREEQARQAGCEELDENGLKVYRLPIAERIKRIQSVLHGIGALNGGAKQTIHYTPVSPVVAIFAVTKGGNHPFNYLFTERMMEGSKKTLFEQQVFTERLADSKNDLLSPVYVGWAPGFLNEQRQIANSTAVDGTSIEYSTPRVAFQRLSEWLASNSAVWDK